jgi:hypothetical protein
MEIKEIVEHEDGSATMVLDAMSEEEQAVLIEKGMIYLLLLEAFNMTSDELIRLVVNARAMDEAKKEPVEEGVPGWEYAGTPV